LKTKNGRNIVIVFIIAIPLLSFIFLRIGQDVIKKHYLPIYGPKDYDEVSGDTLYHFIPPFEFVNFTGKTVNNDDFYGYVTVVNFIFTNCMGPCVNMSENFQFIQEEFKGEPNLKLLSHTVDPKRDSVAVLAEYAELYDAIPGKWYLVTGDKKDLYKHARKGFYLVADDGDGGDQDFIHSEKLVLVDKVGRIRGYYNGTDEKEVQQLLNDIIMVVGPKIKKKVGPVKIKS